MGSISQLKKLQQRNSFIQLDKNIARLTNFTFKIRSAIFIRSVILNTPIRLITFHIVPINTPFLLCLANMDKLGLYFNNITN